MITVSAMRGWYSFDHPMTPTMIQLGLETTIDRKNEERLALAAWLMHKAALRELNWVETMNPIDVHRRWEDMRHTIEVEKALAREKTPECHQP